MQNDKIFKNIKLETFNTENCVTENCAVSVTIIRGVFFKCPKIRLHTDALESSQGASYGRKVLTNVFYKP